MISRLVSVILSNVSLNSNSSSRFNVTCSKSSSGRTISLSWATLSIFTARCTTVQSTVLRSHVVCLSVRPSICLSVTLVDCDHIGCNSSKIISPSVSLGCSLFESKHHGSTPRGTPRNFRPNRGGVLKKVAFGVQSSNISETRQDRTKVTIEVE